MAPYRFWSMLAVLLALAAINFLDLRQSEAAGPFYVIAGEAYLRECPGPDCSVVCRLYRSDQVEYLDTNGYGWWKVRALRNNAVGWMTADLLSAVTPTPPPSPPPYPGYYYINASRINLHTYPMYSSGVTGVVQLNERVEKLGDSPQGWAKVRSLRNGSEGWLLRGYLSLEPVSYPRRSYTTKKRSRPAAPTQKKEEESTPSTEKAKPM
ncbi:SH3 domain-containing protein [Desulfobacca acetoxidans]|uniref:SH3 domain protein n=1 Tax=Desulfobacca acetoxidans (strain ATCC 700848 / DSM 11109 / ASRB2) TaxID=880072 RepID=F2NFL8_DESAR|nr:SH3 domain-containing protein [Desulfobacca acetoxidans]AEB10137.1 SH3 domain protein [Desulfobacca acetoxidans DSM 11109]HAY21197.1 SH3 domain-containing protein [Desulfobacterales bacterium]